VTLPRFRPLTIAVAIGVAALLGVLYWIARPDVHALPDSLKPLAETRPPAPMAAVVFEGTDGKLHGTDAFKGKLVLFNLWAPWCAPCVKELPALAALEKALPEDRFAVVAVDVGRDSAADAQAFLASHGAGALTAYHDANESVFRAYGAYGLPMSLLVDAKGQEIARSLGPADWAAPDSIAYLKYLAAR
jgi:thiol-disulfide isomerase/thioredoxin